MKKYHALHRMRTFSLSSIALLSGYLMLVSLTSRKPIDRLDVRIFTPTSRDSFRLKKLDIHAKRKNGGKYIDATVSEKELLKIRNEGFEVALMSSLQRYSNIPHSYQPLNEIEDQVKKLVAKYPKLVSIEKIGFTTSLRQPIWGIKVSDNAALKEDEPRIIFTGVHHAREPIGANICLNIINTLCTRYHVDKKIRNWVNNLEMWFVPVVNPDGYKYVMDNNLGFPWWRKNLRDNDNNGVFNPMFDGVDLNRNYDYNWDEGGDNHPSSWFYRGRKPFSENEVKAVTDLAIRENFVMGISYHSYGESILFPWGNYKSPPDLDLIVEIAGELASNIRKESGSGKYSILPLNGRVGQSSIWMYGQMRVIDYIVEVGTEYFPADEKVQFILKENLNGAFYIFDRVLSTGIKGHVFDIDTKQPLSADVAVIEFASDYVKPRKTDLEFGSFHRLVNPGKFTLTINSDGYHPKVFENIKVRKGKYVNLEVGLHNKHKKITNGISN